MGMFSWKEVGAVLPPSTKAVLSVCYFLCYFCKFDSIARLAVLKRIGVYEISGFIGFDETIRTLLKSVKSQF
jgi:hypothetical protein